MLDPTVVDRVALLLVGGLWGGMAFYAAVFTPLVFAKLEPEAAGRFIREVFPAYYLAMGLTSALATGALALGGTHGGLDLAAMGLVCAGFWIARQALLPRLDRAREARSAGSAAAGRFRRLHRSSVLLNAVQLVAVAVVLARFV